MSRARHISLMIAAVSLPATHPAQVPAQEIRPDLYQTLEYRHIGPAGNRLISVVGVPGDPWVYYAGGASGGIFKTTDGGIHWEPIFDDQPVSSIGALAIAPSDPNVVWAGTGETFIRANVSLGNGIYRSTDGGKIWTHMGLEKTGRIGRIVIDPRDPDIVFAAAMGHSYGPQEERGVFRTTDGGKTWERVLFVDENTGASDIAMDPNNPRILFAGMWQLEIHTWGRESGGPGSGLFMSRDGGDTWTRLIGNGLPRLPVGKVAVCMTPSNSNRVYALIETGDGVPWHGQETESGELWRSDDGGDNWALVSRDRNLAGRTHYYSRCAVAPDDEETAYFLSNNFSISVDGGKQATVTTRGLTSPGGDSHDIWIDPTDGDRMIVAHDHGVSISVNRSLSWHQVELPVAQMYHVAVDSRIPYYVYGNMQDGASQRGPSNSRVTRGGIPRGMWHSVGGGESGFAIPDPVDPNIIWATSSGYGSVGGIVDRFDESRREIQRMEVWPESTIGWPAAELKYRFNWTFPLSISPHDHNTVYVGSQHVHRMTGGGGSWEVISPDLSTNDKSRQQISGGLTPDNVGVEYGGVLFAIAESPVERGVIWAGTNDGLVQLTRDGGGNWTDVTPNIPDLPEWGTVSNIEPSRYEAGKAYITVDFHQVNNRDPYIYRTTDYGQSWKRITNGIPSSVFSYAHCIREDPVRPGLLYLGTENAIYVSFDDGESWLPLQTNLPHAPVHWMVIQENFNDLVVATYGRGFWILDDITPLQQLTSDVLSASSHLFTPRPAYRFRTITRARFMPDDPGIGQNPRYGASINYYLGSAPQDSVTITISDQHGETIRTLNGTKETGINRIMWDLRTERSQEIRLRTSPLYAPDLRVGPEGWRAYPGSGSGRISVLVAPGTYTVTLSVDGETHTQQLAVLKDPNTAGSEADIRAKVEMLLALQSDMNATAETINQIELTRKQIYDLKAVLEDDESATEILAAADQLDEKLIAVEENLFQMKLTRRGQDFLRWPSKLVFKFTHLANGVGVADFPPMPQQREVHEVLKARLRQYQAELAEVLRTDLAAFNRMLQERNIANVIAMMQ